jgi:hypothetical protein
MSMPGTSTLPEDDEIGGGASHAILFHVAGAGLISVHSTPSRVPAHSDSGDLGVLAIMKPGSGIPVARSVPAALSAGTLTLNYQVSAADAAAGGMWSVRVTNLTDDTLSWHTTISGVVAVPQVVTASIDLAFINTVLSVAAAAFNPHAHLETSGDPTQLGSRFYVSTQTNGVPNTIVYQKYIADIQKLGATYRLNVDSDPTQTTVMLTTDPIALSLHIGFNVGGVALTALTTGFPDITFSAFEIDVAVGFDGTIVPSCYVEAHPATIGDAVDVAAEVESQATSQVAALANDPTFGAYLRPAVLHDLIIKYISIFLRLGPTETIQQFHSDGATLFVDYLAAVSPTDPVPPVHPPLPPVNPVPSGLPEDPVGAVHPVFPDAAEASPVTAQTGGQAGSQASSHQPLPLDEGTPTAGGIQ